MTEKTVRTYIAWRLWKGPAEALSTEQLYREAVRLRPEVAGLSYDEFYHQYKLMRRLNPKLQSVRAYDPFFEADHLPVAWAILSVEPFWQLLDIHWERWKDHPKLDEIAGEVIEQLQAVIVQAEGREVRHQALQLLARFPARKLGEVSTEVIEQLQAMVVQAEDRQVRRQALRLFARLPS